MNPELSTVSTHQNTDSENVVPLYIYSDITSMLWDAQQAVKKYVTAHPSLESKVRSSSSESTSASSSSSSLYLSMFNGEFTSPENEKEQEDALSLLYSKLVKIQAPMVRCSRPSFRKLCRLWGTDISYTAMIMAESFAHSSAARDADFSLYKNENRLVVQLASSGGPDAALAAVQLQPYCDAIDLNCGCPQKWAMREGIGAAMLQKPEQVSDMVHSIRNALSARRATCAPSAVSSPIPCVVKMRVGEDIRKSVDFARQCVAAGASWITVHGRTPQCSSHAPVRWKDIQLIREVLEAEGVPVVANGGVVDMPSAVLVSLACGTGGVMSANGLLDNPAAFSLRQRLDGTYFYSSSSFIAPSDTPDTLCFLPDPYDPFSTAECWIKSSSPMSFFDSQSSPFSSSPWWSPSSSSGFRASLPPPPPREVLSDFLRLVVDMDMPSTASIQHFLRMARWYLSPSERSYMATLQSNLALLVAVEESGLYTTRGRYQNSRSPTVSS